MESVEIPLNSTPTFNEYKDTTIISKAGDLLHTMHYDVLFEPTTVGSVSSYSNWTNGTGYAYIKDVSIEIGNQEIDKR